MGRAVAVAAFLGWAALSGPVAAAPLADGGATAQEIVRVLQDKGYRAELGKDRDGDPMITSASDGGDFRVLFYGCKAGRCNSIQFTAAYDLPQGLTLQRINVWNSKKRFGRGFLDEVNDPFVQMDLDLEHGSTTESVANNLDTWVAVLREFRTFINE